MCVLMVWGQEVNVRDDISEKDKDDANWAHHEVKVVTGS